MYQQQQQGFGQPPMGPAMGGGYGAPPTDQERQFAMLAHLSPLLVGFIGPLIFMLIDVGGQPSAFVKHNAKQASSGRSPSSSCRCSPAASAGWS